MRRSRRARLTREERDRIIALLVIFFFVIFFWTGFEQAGSSMNLFAQERTDRDVFGYLVPAAWFQSINPVFILLLGAGVRGACGSCSPGAAASRARRSR